MARVLFAAPGHTPRPLGPRPAAGIVIRAVDPDDATVYYLLGRRSRSLGGTWANFGGSLRDGEDSLAGAVRELAEETRIRPHALSGCTVATAIDCGTVDVPYTLFVLDAPAAVFELDARLSWENSDIAWIPAGEVAGLNLHPGFRRAWEVLS